MSPVTRRDFDPAAFVLPAGSSFYQGCRACSIRTRSRCSRKCSVSRALVFSNERDLNEF